MSSPIVFVDFAQLNSSLDSNLALNCMDQSCTSMVVTKEGSIKWVAAAKLTGHKTPRMRGHHRPGSTSRARTRGRWRPKNNFSKIFFNMLGAAFQAATVKNIVEVNEVKGAGEDTEIGLTSTSRLRLRGVEVVVRKFIQQQFWLDRMVQWDEYIEESKEEVNVMIDISETSSFRRSASRRGSRATRAAHDVHGRVLHGGHGHPHGQGKVRTSAGNIVKIKPGKLAVGGDSRGAKDYRGDVGLRCSLASRFAWPILGLREPSRVGLAS